MAGKPKEALRKARSELYRRHILDAAEEVFATNGFDNAKVQDIASAAGLSMGTLYSIFPGKEDLFAALLEERGATMLEIARRAGGRSDRGAIETLHGLIDDYIGFFVAHPTFLRMHLSLGTSWMLEPRGPTEHQARIWQEIHEIQSAIFRSGIEEGVFIEEDPEFLAKLFSAMDQALLSDWASNGMQAGAAELSARLSRLVERTLLR